MNTLEQMKQIIAEMEPNMQQLFVAGKSTYSVKVRNNALALQKLCARMRVEAQSHKLTIQGGRQFEPAVSVVLQQSPIARGERGSMH